MSEPLKKWANEVAALLGPEISIDLNLCWPHPKFKYPEYPRLPTEEDQNPALYLKTLIAGPTDDEVVLFPSLEGLLRSSLGFFKKNLLSGSQGLPFLVCLSPPSPALFEIAREQKFEIFFLPKDPEHWPDAWASLRSMNAKSVFFLSHPNAGDGFGFPPIFLVQLVDAIAREFPDCPLMIDETLALFSFEAFPPGRVLDIPKDNPIRNSLFQINSVYPGMAPTGPEVAWIRWSRNTRWNRVFFPAEVLDIDSARIAARAMLAFSSRQGPAVSEFHRRMLGVQRGLKGLSDALVPYVHTKKIRVPYWPTQGFTLHFELNLNNPTLSKKHSTVRSFALELARDFRILVIPGDLFGSPSGIQICYASPLALVEKASERLRRAFEAML